MYKKNRRHGHRSLARIEKKRKKLDKAVQLGFCRSMQLVGRLFPRTVSIWSNPPPPSVPYSSPPPVKLIKNPDIIYIYLRVFYIYKNWLIDKYLFKKLRLDLPPRPTVSLSLHIWKLELTPLWSARGLLCKRTLTWELLSIRVIAVRGREETPERNSSGKVFVRLDWILPLSLSLSSEVFPITLDIGVNEFVFVLPRLLDQMHQIRCRNLWSSRLIGSLLVYRAFSTRGISILYLEIRVSIFLLGC